jgi:DNA-binding IclR family transcriptional regulator
MVSAGITARVLAIIESFSPGTDEGLTTQTIIQRSGLPASTVYRLLIEFEDLGLVYRTADKRMHPNFGFERRLSFENIAPENLDTACQRISDTLRSAAEIIALRGANLLWHVVKQHPGQAIRLRAHSGYARAPYELDSITRLALAYCPITFVEKHWDVTAFFDVGVKHTPIAWNDVRETLEAVDRDDMQFDLEGNAKGVRRFCVAVRDGPRIACLLTVAEAATPLRDASAHIARIRDILFEQRRWVEAAGPAVCGHDEEFEAGEIGAA